MLHIQRHSIGNAIVPFLPLSIVVFLSLVNMTVNLSRILAQGFMQLEALLAFVGIQHVAFDAS